MRVRILRQDNTLTLTHGAGATTVATPATNAAGALVLNGILQGLIISTPAAVDSSATVTVNLIDQDGNTVYTKSGLAVNTVTQVNLTPNNTDGSVPLSGLYQLQVVFSAAQTSADRATKVVLLIDEG